MANIPGGGYGSKTVVHTNAHKTAHPSTRAVRPGSADMLGQALAFEPPDLFDGPGYEGPMPPAQAPGPGGGRNVMRSGSQMTYGPVARGEADTAPDVPATRGGRDILKDYGPERS
jgi:hypothetical protein